ncbi:hypothetical protein G9A89_020145 [Geosiphon pyriformis]|nr:hypothetical protein G9A89_020145 [Geosiphon pyriformis]
MNNSGNNFSVLKGTFTQVLVFAVESVVEDALEKNKELWLVLQDMRKAYDFIAYDISRCVTGLSSFLAKIFYDPLLCEVKKHKYLCKYWIDIKFVAKSDKVESGGGMSSFFAAEAFVDDTIWVRDCQASMQYALNIASKFFTINNISINSEKTVAISINQGIKIASLNINGQPISIAKKDETHRYLEIFLLIEGLFKLSLVKAHLNIHFFINVVLKKAITDKQFLYLVFISSNVCHKWDALVRKGLKLKAGLLCDFLDAALHYSSLYGLKFFKQIQAESKLAAVVVFSNASDILGHLFDHRFLDLQFPVKLRVSPVNNFLAGVVKIFLGNKLFLTNNLPCAFRGPGNFLMSLVLGSTSYFGFVHSLKQFGVVFGDRLLDKKSHKRLDPRESVSYWFEITFRFLHNGGALSSGLVKTDQLSGLDILASEEFSDLHSSLHELWSGFFMIYTDSLLKNYGSSGVADGTAAYFPIINCSIGVRVRGLLSSILIELQTVILVLECVFSSSTVLVHLDSQAAIDACVSELSLLVPNFQVLCWMERRHIFNLVREKNLSVSWIKVKDYSGVYGNVEADTAAGAATCSRFSLSIGMREWLLIAEDLVVSDNAHHFVKNMFRSVCCMHWKTGPGHNVIQSSLIECMDWNATSRFSVLQSYLIKAVHHHLPVAVRKRLYDKNYPGVLCLLCREVELPDYVFFCVINANVHNKILAETAAFWVSLMDSCVSLSSAVLWFLGCCSSDISLYLAICKGFVMSNWCLEAIEILENRKLAVGIVVNFLRSIAEMHYCRVWLIRSSYKVSMEKVGLVGNNRIILGLSYCKTAVLSDGMVQLLGVLGLFSVSFGHCRPNLFFSGLDFNSCVIISV